MARKFADGELVGFSKSTPYGYYLGCGVVVGREAGKYKVLASFLRSPWQFRNSYINSNIYLLLDTKQMEKATAADILKTVFYSGDTWKLFSKVTMKMIIEHCLCVCKFEPNPAQSDLVR